MNIALPLAALCGFIVHEAVCIMPAIKLQESSPDKFSFGYYFSRPRNIVLLVMNMASTIALLVASSEVTHFVGLLLSKIPGIGPDLDPSGYPLLTGIAMGYGGSWLFRVATMWMKKKAPEVKDVD